MLFFHIRVQAALANIELNSWADQEQGNFAQSNLLILSAYYGALLPFDLISNITGWKWVLDTSPEI